MHLPHRAFPGSLVAAVLLASPAGATSVARLSLPQMADHAGQVITGDVRHVRSYWADEPRRIETEITLDNVAYLKGAHPLAAAHFTITVPGGTVGDWSMRIEGAPQFAPGQTWVLFLLPEYRTYPVVGVAQGAFQLRSDADGLERVYQSGHAVTGVDARGFVQVLEAGHVPPPALAARPGPRTTLGLTAPPAAATLTRDQFMKQLAPILGASVDHALTEPAGRRVPGDLTPVPLREAGS